MFWPLQIQHFDFSPLWQNTLTLAAYTLLSLSLLFLYVVKNQFLRASAVFLTLLLALYAGRITVLGIVWIVSFGAIFYYSIHAKNRWWRGLSFLVTLVLALSVMMVKVPGIHNWPVISKIVLSPGAIPYSMWFTFDKSMIGLIFLCFSPLSLANGGKWWPVVKTGWLWGCSAVMVLLPLSYLLHYIQLDFKLTDLFFLWAVHNLLFTCIAEEVIFRGMIQHFLMIKLARFKWGLGASLVIAALLFGAAHYRGGYHYMFLAAVAGLFYGYAFIKTKKIEAGVIAHFLVNSVHFIVFTYPALASAFNR